MTEFHAQTLAGFLKVFKDIQGLQFGVKNLNWQLAMPFWCSWLSRSTSCLPQNLLYECLNAYFFNNNTTSIIEVHHKTLLVVPMIRIAVMMNNTKIALVQAASAGRRAECTTPSPKGVAISMT